MKRWCATGTVAVALALASPVAARAATITVDPQVSPGCMGATCSSLDAASSMIGDGDTVVVHAGTYLSGPLTLHANDLTIAGSGPATFVGITGNGGEPGLTITGARVTLRDLVVYSTRGAAVSVQAPATTTLQRVAAFATAPGASAVEFVSGGATGAPRRLVLDSSVLSGGSGAAGLLAATNGTGAMDDLVVDAHHISTAGQAYGVVLDARTVSSPPQGNIAATISDSIVHGTNLARTSGGGGAASASLTFVRSDASQALGNGTIAMGGASLTPDARLFADPFLHLRPDAPLLDRTSNWGFSTRDIDGDPRLVGSAVDLGADEFDNRPPTAVLHTSATQARQGDLITFSAQGSQDPESAVGGGIAYYLWDFGDGPAWTTLSPQTYHVYVDQGTYTPRVAVVDRQGGHTIAAGRPIQITDGPLPAITIDSPRAGQRVARAASTVRRDAVMRSLRFTGRAGDDHGIQRVEVALLGSYRRHGGKRGCTWLTARWRLHPGSCDVPRFLPARFSGASAWRFVLPPSARVRPGRYLLLARAVNELGVVSRPRLHTRSIVRFNIR